MSDTTLPPLTADDFRGWANHNGVDLIEDENATWVIAHGHIDKATFADAVNAYDEDANGAPLDDDDKYTDDDVQHMYAVTKAAPPEWWATWRDVTSQTPGAFPITVVTR